MTGKDQWRSLYTTFRWQVPERFNIAQACAQRWATDRSRIAIRIENGTPNPPCFTYAALAADANRLSNALRALGVRAGDRVAIVMAQRAETAIAHLAVVQLGAIATPLSVLFGDEALAYRLRDSAAVAAICDDTALDVLATLVATGGAGPAFACLIAVAAARPGVLAWNDLLARASDRFAPIDTASSDPAVLVYTSGTTGPPKGALIPHAALIGNLPGFVASQNWFPQSGDVFWSPADWAWTGGLMDALLPTLYFGFPIVAYRGRFDPEHALALMERHGVTNAFVFPTALKIMMRQVPRPRAQHRLRLRALMSAGEAVGATVFEWTRAALGVTVNEMFGQTEANYVVGNSSARWPALPGAMGRPYPGHRVAVIDDAGQPVEAGEVGEVAVHRRDIHGHPDPVFFIGYWNDPDATQRKFTGAPADSWLRTGDLAHADERGTLWYQGRADDMFKSSGYRIGPGEIEQCLIGHDAVANAAVVPSPDAERGALVKAFIVLAPGYRDSAALIESLQAHVRSRLATYDVPKEIEFIDALPMTTTGKIQRRVLRDRERQRAAVARQAAGLGAAEK